jgi:hypothetical protein
MKVIRFIAGLFGFVVAWVAVAVLVTLPIHCAFPGAGIEVFGVQLATMPGSILGVMAGYRVYQIVSGDRPSKATR